MIVGTQADSSRVLLAHYAKRHSDLCQSLRQMLKIQQHHPTAVRRIDPYNNPMVVHLVEVKHYETVSNSGVTAEVPDSGHRLLHKMGGS